MMRLRLGYAPKIRTILTMVESLDLRLGSGSAFRLVIGFFLLLGCASPAFAFGTKTIPVRILVDEEEKRVESLWQETLGRRLAKASDILSRYSQVKFSVTKFSSWDSEDGHGDFVRSLNEFEKEADPKPAELAIGFTSQYELMQRRSHLGGTRGPMRRHILIREGAKVQEIERLEVLVHELAHYLGAAHSPEAGSVMRPVLGDGQSRARSFQIKLDRSNAKLISLVSKEMVDRNVKSMHQLTLPTKVQVRNLYAEIAQGFGEDKVAGRYVAIMDRSIKMSIAARQKQIEAARRAAERLSKSSGNTTDDPPAAVSASDGKR